MYIRSFNKLINLFCVILNAQVTSSKIGLVGYSEINVAARSDRKIDIPFERPKICKGTINSILGNTRTNNFSSHS